MNILVIGSGGREHALLWKISQSPLCEKLFCAPGNAGTSSLAQNVPIQVDEIDNLLSFAKNNFIDLTVVGPELPLTLGIVDRFKAEGLACFGPSRLASRLEGSKSFAKDFMRRLSIPTANYDLINTREEAQFLYQKYGLPVVLKEDGLASGKGVFVCFTENEFYSALDRLFSSKDFKKNKKVVIEECLIGEEASYLVICDGKDFVPLASSQDHKRLLDGDVGPNTGGMGAYSPALVFTKPIETAVQNSVIKPLLRGMAEKGCEFRGLLYVGVMITKEGPKVLEFNVRFGDPETQPIMARLKSDIVPVFVKSVSGSLKDIKLEWDHRSAVCVVLASEGYPELPKRGEKISGLERVGTEDVFVFHAGTAKNNGSISVNGGRVLGVTALGDNLKNAIFNAYKAVDKIEWPGKIYRKDIGQRGISL